MNILFSQYFATQIECAQMGGCHTLHEILFDAASGDHNTIDLR